MYRCRCGYCFEYPDRIEWSEYIGNGMYMPCAEERCPDCGDVDFVELNEDYEDYDFEEEDEEWVA